MDNRRKMLSLCKILDNSLPGKYAITIIIYDSADATKSHTSEMRWGYNLTKSLEKINYLMYMESIKLFVKNEKELETLIQAVRIYNQAISMENGVE